MDNLQERVSELEAKVDNLNKRLQLEECRWIPKTEVVLVWYTNGNMSPETLLGVFSTQAIADAYMARTSESEKMKAGKFRSEVVAMDTCLAPVVQ